MEVSFSREARMLRRGAGETFHGEGILAITKALLQSGVAYVGGYQGAPVSHLLDVLVQAKDYLARARRARRGLRERGVGRGDARRVDPLSAARRGDVEVDRRHQRRRRRAVEPRVARRDRRRADRRRRGLRRGRERDPGAHATPSRSSRRCCCSIRGRTSRTWCAWSSRRSRCRRPPNTPAMLQLRIRACHVRGSFVCKDNVAPAISRAAPDRRARRRSTTAGSSHPPSTFRHEKLKYDERMPAARRFIVEHALNERVRRHAATTSASSCRAGSTTRSSARCSSSGSPTRSATPSLPMLVLNVVCPLVPDEIARLLRAASARCWWSRKASRSSSSRRSSRSLRRHDVDTPVARQGRAADGRRIHGRGDRARPRGVRRARRRPSCRSPRARRWLAAIDGAARRGRARSSPRRCRRGRRSSASAVPSGRCSRR